MVKNLLSTLLIVFLLSSCASTEKYNQQITKQHSPKKLRNDVDYAYKKLQKLHPDLYWYISKYELDEKFETLKSNLKNSLSSDAFYMHLAPVIASIKQGHTAIYRPRKKKTKRTKKDTVKNKNPFKPFGLQFIDNKLIVVKNYENDSILITGSQLLSVENEKVENLLASFQKLATGDGYNKTFMPEFTGKYFGGFYIATHKKRDSILVSLKNNDSIYHRYLYFKEKKNIRKKKTKDSLQLRRTKIERKLSKKNKKVRKLWEYKYGYNKYTKERARNFKFLVTDSIHTVSYLKIRSFNKGNYKKFYQESFAKIDSAQSENLIIDLRGNLGGRIAEIDELYSYLTDKEYIFVKEAKMTQAKSFMYPYLHSKSWVTKSGSILFYPVLVFFKSMKVKKINGKPNFQFKSSKLRKPKTANYKGKIYVLINGTSFSASTIISNHLQATKRATFVGEETGGAYNGTVAGIFANIELPNSKIRMRVGLMNIKTPYSIEPDGFGVKPDIHIKTTKIDKDEQLEWVLNDILKN